MKLFAQEPHDLAPSSGLHGIGPLGTPSASAGSIFIQVATLISVVITAFSIIAGLWFLWQIIMGGYAYITSGGDKEKLHIAQQKLTQALLGLLIVLGATFAVTLISYVLGIDLLNVSGLLELLSL